MKIYTSLSFDTQARIFVSVLSVAVFTLLGLGVENVGRSTRILTIATGFILSAVIWVFRGPRSPHD